MCEYAFLTVDLYIAVEFTCSDMFEVQSQHMSGENDEIHENSKAL
jgi:hypothetical protein